MKLILTDEDFIPKIYFFELKGLYENFLVWKFEARYLGQMSHFSLGHTGHQIKS